MMTSGQATLLSGATGTGAGTTTVVGTRVRHWTFYIIAAGTVSGTVVIQAKDAGGNWQAISTNALSSAGTTVVQKEGIFAEVRANVTVYSSGTYTVYCDFAS